MTRISSYTCDTCHQNTPRDQVTGVDMHMDGLNTTVDPEDATTHICQSCMGAIAEHVKPVCAGVPRCAVCGAPQSPIYDLKPVVNTNPSNPRVIKVMLEGDTPQPGPVVSHMCTSCHDALQIPAVPPAPEKLAEMLRDAGVVKNHMSNPAINRKAARVVIAKHLIDKGVKI